MPPKKKARIEPPNSSAAIDALQTLSDIISHLERNRSKEIKVSVRRQGVYISLEEEELDQQRQEIDKLLQEKAGIKTKYAKLRAAAQKVVGSNALELGGRIQELNMVVQDGEDDEELF